MLSKPEKLGEVFAGLHILLVCQILKRIAKEKSLESECSVKGSMLSIDLYPECQGEKRNSITLKVYHRGLWQWDAFILKNPVEPFPL